MMTSSSSDVPSSEHDQPEQQTSRQLNEHLAPRQRTPGQVTVGKIGITVGVAIVLHAPALVRKEALNSDEATIATVARMLRHGASLYSTAVDRKPPGAFTLYRLIEPVFGSWTLTAGRWIALAATITAMWILGFEARRRWPAVSPFAVAVVGVIAFSLLPAEDSRAVGFELLATLPAVGAFVLGARGRTVLAGIALGIAALFKQPMLLGAIPLAVQCLFGQCLFGQGLSNRGPAGAESWTRRFRRLLAAGAATVATIVAGLAPFGLSKAWSWYSGSGDKYLGGTRLTTVTIVTLEQVGSFAGLTMGLLILAAISLWRRRTARLPIDLDVVVWFVTSMVATAIGLRFILHYFNQVLPALVLLVAPLLTSRAEFRGRMPRAGLVWLFGGVAFSGWTLLAPNLFHDIPRVDHIAAAIDARTKPGDRIFVWGQAPEIYWTSDRDPATRYPHIGFITGVTPKRPGVPAYVLSQTGAATNLLSDLEKNRPVLIIDAAIASVRGGNRYPLAKSPIAAFVAANYCEVEVVDKMRLLSPCIQ